MRVTGGIEGETMKARLRPDSRPSDARALLAGRHREDLERLAEGQRDDGGWEVDFASYSPAASLEWRGHATVRAVTIPKRNAVI